MLYIFLTATVFYTVYFFSSGYTFDGFLDAADISANKLRSASNVKTFTPTVNDVTLWFASNADATNAYTSLSAMQPQFRGSTSVTLTAGLGGFLVAPVNATNIPFLITAQAQFTKAVTLTELNLVYSSPCFSLRADTCNSCGAKTMCGWCPGKNICLPKSVNGTDPNDICNAYSFQTTNTSCGSSTAPAAPAAPDFPAFPTIPAAPETDPAAAAPAATTTPDAPPTQPAQPLPGSASMATWSADWLVNITDGCPSGDTVKKLLRHFQSCGY